MEGKREGGASLWSPQLSDQLTAGVFFGWFVMLTVVRATVSEAQSGPATGMKTGPLLLLLGAAVLLFKSRPSGAWLVGIASMLLIVAAVVSGGHVYSILAAMPFAFVLGYCGWRIVTRKSLPLIDALIAEPAKSEPDASKQAVGESADKVGQE